MTDRPGRLELLGLVALLLLAAITRLPGLDERGRFDADQGGDMAVLLDLVDDGVLPLLGAKTSVGDFHQAAFYYYLLAPAAYASGADPTAVTAWIALFGIATVASAWWLARSMAGSGRGPLAGLVAALLAAVSPAAIEASTFIWNPNLIPFFSIWAVGGAWRATQTRRTRWWVVALTAAAAIVGLHVIGIVFLAAIVGLWLIETARAAPGERRRLLGAAALAAGTTTVLFLPLLWHELQTGFSETRLILAYLGGGGLGDGSDPLSRLLFAALRVVSWPFVGLVTEAPAVAAAWLAVFVGLVGWGLVSARGPARRAMAWLAGITAWCTLGLAVGAPSLQHVVPGLPTNHYHAFLDPLLAVMVALAVAGLVSLPGPPGVAALPKAVAAVVVVALVGLGVTRWPPAVDPEGGWAAARAAGQRIVENAGDRIVLLGLPAVKSPAGIGFPIRRAGGELVPPGEAFDSVVVACDRLFEPVIGVPCGGLAEDLVVRDRIAIPGGELPFEVARFDASPRTSISIYAPR